MELEKHEVLVEEDDGDFLPFGFRLDRQIKYDLTGLHLTQVAVNNNKPNKDLSFVFMPYGTVGLHFTFAVPNLIDL